MNSAHSTPVIVPGSGDSKLLEPIVFNETKGSYDERWLQGLIDANPPCLPVGEIEPGFVDLISVCRELPTKHGPIDNLLMTPDGNIVLVEVKLWRNPESRRKVVAQALDYASCLFDMEYDELEKAVIGANHGAKKAPNRLYDLFSRDGGLSEPAFIDAVSRNLRKGRALILVVGDGIRTESARLAALVQSHAGAHFTFALVELCVFKLPDGDSLIICPRTLVQTEMIQRGVIQIDDQRVRVMAVEKAEESEAKRPRDSISAEQFFESMGTIRPDIPDRLRKLIASVEGLGVKPEFRRSLILRWEAPNGVPVNLGYIEMNGRLWTDATNWKIPHDVSHEYHEELAEALGIAVNTEGAPSHWHVAVNGKAPRIDEVADNLDRWPPVIARLQERLKNRLSPAVQGWSGAAEHNRSDKSVGDASDLVPLPREQTGIDP